MIKTTALIFGDNDYTSEIKKNLEKEYRDIFVFTLTPNTENSFDLSDNWDTLSDKVDIEKCTAFCVLEAMSENVFLTISLRDRFKDLEIIALSLDEESQNKLVLAGATNVLPTMQMTANVIVDILEKPTVTEVLHEILYEKSNLKIVQVKVKNSMLFETQHITDTSWREEYGILIISLTNKNNSKEFIYSSYLKEHKVQDGDVLIVVGYDEDIKTFEKLIGTKNED